MQLINISSCLKHTISVFEMTGNKSDAKTYNKNINNRIIFHEQVLLYVSFPNSASNSLYLSSLKGFHNEKFPNKTSF